MLLAQPQKGSVHMGDSPKFEPPHFKVGDKVNWTEAARKKFAPKHGEGPFTVHEIRSYSEAVLAAQERGDLKKTHPQLLVLKKDDTDPGRGISGDHFRPA